MLCQYNCSLEFISRNWRCHLRTWISCGESPLCSQTRKAQASCKARWLSSPTGTILLAWELEQREREREIMASGCCNPSCWSNSRHEQDDELAAKNTTHVLASGRTLKHLMICFNKCALSHKPPENGRSSICFFSPLLFERTCFAILLGLSYSKYGSWTSILIVTWSRLEMENLGLHPKPSDSDSAFSPTCQVIHMHLRTEKHGKR